MTTHIHICPVGFFSAPILDSVGIMPADRYYFLYNNNEKVLNALGDVEDALSRLGYTDLHRIVVDPFDYQSVMNAIMRIHHDEMSRDIQSAFYVNFTSGTNIVAGACCTCASFIGATLYYVVSEDYAPETSRNDRVKIINASRVPDVERIKPFPRRILRMICEAEDGVTIRHISSMLATSPQNINHHLNRFMDQGLIEKDKEGRKVILKGTDTGRMLCQWMPDE